MAISKPTSLLAESGRGSGHCWLAPLAAYKGDFPSLSHGALSDHGLAAMLVA